MFPEASDKSFWQKRQNQKEGEKERILDLPQDLWRPRKKFGKAWNPGMYSGKLERHGGKDRLLDSGQKWLQGFSLQKNMCLTLMGIIKVENEPLVIQKTDLRTTSLSIQSHGAGTWKSFSWSGWRQGYTDTGEDTCGNRVYSLFSHYCNCLWNRKQGCPLNKKGAAVTFWGKKHWSQSRQEENLSETGVTCPARAHVLLVRDRAKAACSSCLSPKPFE